MEVVAQNSEATLAFRELAASVLLIVAGEEDVELIEPVHRCWHALGINDEGVFTIPDFRVKPDHPDQIINLIIQGTLRLVSCVLRSCDIDDPDYQAALTMLTGGVMKLNQEAMLAERGRRGRR